MTNSTTPIRIDADLLALAKVVGRRQSRSAAQQVAHWARLGREVEASRSVSAHRVDAVLAGHEPYDDLDVEEQAAVRAEWGARLDAVADGVDLTARFTAMGRASWVDVAPDGTVVVRTAASPTTE